MAIANTENLFVAGATLMIPPASLVDRANLSVMLNRLSTNGTLLYPTQEFIFPVTVQVDMARDQSLVIPVEQVPEIQNITAFLSPKTTLLAASVPGTSEHIASLQQFAQDFEAAFPSLHLAIGNERPHKHSASASADDLVFQPLWAVHLNKTHGIHYDIQEAMPFFFTPAPLSNTLLAGTAQIGVGPNKQAKQVEAIDLNVLARDFLGAVEDFLEPAIAIPVAKRNQSDKVQAILEAKAKLADAISDQVTHILSSIDPELPTRRKIAADRLKQQLLINLVEAFDIETIVQYNVNVNVAGVEANDSN